jgi:hypothetical protein
MGQQTAVDLLLTKIPNAAEIKEFISNNDADEKMLDEWLFERIYKGVDYKQMEKQQRKNDITDYNIKVTEFLLNPSFNLEHSNHGIACEKLADIRNEFIKNQ